MDTQPEANAGAAANPPVAQQTQTEPPKGPSEEYKGLQRKIAQLEKELASRPVSNDIGELKEYMKELISTTKGNQALTMDVIEGSTAVEDEGDGQPRPKLKHYQQHQAADAQRRAQQAQAEWDRKVKQSQDELRETIKDAEEDPDADTFKPAWAHNDVLEGPKIIIKNLAARVKELKEQQKTMPDEATVAKLVEEQVRKKLVESGVLKADMSQGSGGGKGRKPSLEELQASSPWETDAKVRSGEWKL